MLIDLNLSIIKLVSLKIVTSLTKDWVLQSQKKPCRTLKPSWECAKVCIWPSYGSSS